MSRWHQTFNWTPEAVEHLKLLWITEKLTGSEIAERLGGGLSRSAVMGKISRLGLPNRNAVRVSHARPYSPVAPRKRWRTGETSRPVFPDMLDLKNDPASGSDGAPNLSRSVRLSVPAPEPSKNWLITEFPDDPRDPKYCRYAVTHTTPYRFCGNATEPGESWCATHGKLVTIPGSKPRIPAKTWAAWS